MNDVFCDKRDCLFWDVDGICNCVMHDGIPYCKIESIDTEKDAADGLREENARLRECLREFADAIKNDDGFGVDQGWMLERMSEIGIRGQ